MSTKHTRGPWYAEFDTLGGEIWWNVVDEDGESIASDLYEAEARLISAAPDMLEALGLALIPLTVLHEQHKAQPYNEHSSETMQNIETAVEAIVAALRKAKGE